MSLRYVLLSFVGMGWAFYELSGGASFAPPARPDKTDLVAEQPTSKIAPTQIATQIEPATTSLSPLKVAAVTAMPAHDVAATPARPKANPALRDHIVRTQLSRASAALTATHAAVADGTSANGALRLSALEGGLAAITTDAPAPTPLATERIAPTPKDIRTIHASRVNMRQGPGTSYSVITRLLANDTVVVLEDNGTGWLRLKSQSNGRVGWIAASLVSRKAP